MRIIEKYNLKVGDKIRCNLDGGNTKNIIVEGIIGCIRYDNAIYILNNKHDGNIYEGYFNDLKKYNKKYSWMIKNVDITASNLKFEKINGNNEINFYAKHF